MSRNRGKDRNSGRRGRKHRKEETRERTLHEQRAKEAAQEHATRKQLAEWIEPRIKRLCELSSVGVVIPKRIELIGGRFPRQIYFQKLRAEGLVQNATWGVDKIETHGLTRWLDLNSFVLKRLKEEDWKPLWPKSVLDRLIDATG